MSRQHDLTFTPSSFGGGWLEALTPRAREWAERYFETRASDLPPINAEGWIIEPYEMPSVQAAILQEQLRVEP